MRQIIRLSKLRSSRWAGCFPALILALLASNSVAQTPAIVLDFLPSQTTITFKLGDTLHTVHGAFSLKRGTVTYDPATGEMSGEIVADTASGHTGNGMRDRKMHKEVLESAKYPDMIFRPDHVDGKVGMHGKSNVQVHGVFTVHGSDHEMTIPIELDMTPGHWEATAHFIVPYAKWGMKNPSTFILRVSESVEVDVHATGERPANGNATQQ
ncbi:MAG: YceI family protein [Terriglobales bacterium]